MTKTFLGSLLKVLSKMTSLSMQKFVLKTSEHLVAYMACFPKLAKDFLRTMMNLWSTSSHEQVRILAFLCIRRLALTAPNPWLDSCLKGTIQVYLVSSRVTTAHTWTQLQFMEQCIVELGSLTLSLILLGGLSLASTYQHCFVSLRQLAIQLRQASATKTKENFKHVYNWQYFHCCKLWARMLASYGADMDPKQHLKPLIYPLVQIIIGVMRFNHTH
jgi:nucleolar complex protein 2